MAVAGSPDRGGCNPFRYFDDLRRVPGTDTPNLDILGSTHELYWNSAVRKEAALALAVIGPQAAEPELIGALADPDGDVRYFAADALGAVKTPRARAAISARIEVEKNPTVQSALGVARAKQAR